MVIFFKFHCAGNIGEQLVWDLLFFHGDIFLARFIFTKNENRLFVEKAKKSFLLMWRVMKSIELFFNFFEIILIKFNFLLIF